MIEYLMLRLIDKHWKEHLLNLDMLTELERLPEELKAKIPSGKLVDMQA